MKMSEEQWPSTKEFDPIKDWLNEWDLQVCSDIYCSRPCTCGGDDFCHNLRYAHSIGTFSDPSVGLFRRRLTDMFDTPQELINFVLENKAKLEEEMRKEIE